MGKALWRPPYKSLRLVTTRLAPPSPSETLAWGREQGKEGQAPGWGNEPAGDAVLARFHKQLLAKGAEGQDLAAPLGSALQSHGPQEA